MINKIKGQNSLLNNLIANSSSANPLKIEHPAVQSKQTDTLSISKKDNCKYKKYAISGLTAVICCTAIIKRNQIGKFFSKLLKNKDSIEKTATIVVEEPTKPVAFVENLQQEIIEVVEKVKPKYIIDKIQRIVIKNIEGEQAQKEVYSSKIYSLGGVKVSELNFAGGEMNYLKPTGVKSGFIEGLKKLSAEELSSQANVCKDFGVDVLLANRNVLKSCKLDKNNKLIRVDFSETLGLNADGSEHNFGLVVDELSDFLNPEKYPENAKTYSSLTRETLISSLEKVCSIEAKEIGYKHTLTLSDSSNVLNSVKYYDTMVGRVSFLKKALEVAKQTEQASLSVFEYLEKIKNEAIVKSIEKAKHFTIIKDIERSVENIENQQTKERLSSLLENRVKSLIAEKKNPSEISMFEMGEIFEKFIHKSYKPSDEEKIKIKEQFGRYAVNYLQQPLTHNDLSNMTAIANKNKGKYLEFWKNNPEKMVIYVKSNDKMNEQVLYYDDATWDVVVNSFKSFCENPNLEFAEALGRYGGFGSYDNINGFLRFKGEIDDSLKFLEQEVAFTDVVRDKLNLSLGRMKYFVDKKMYVNNQGHGGGEETKELISEKLNSFIAKNKEGNGIDIAVIKDELQELKAQMNSLGDEANFAKIIDVIQKNPTISTGLEQGMLLGRNERSIAFRSMFLDGENLAELMSEAKGKPELQKKILDYFNNSNPSLHQAGFLSTSIQPYNTLWGDVKWSLKLDKDVKYSYVSDLACIIGHDSGNGEAEILVHPGHKIKIFGAKFKDSKWKIYGEISPG